MHYTGGRWPFTEDHGPQLTLPCSELHVYKDAGCTQTSIIGTKDSRISSLIYIPKSHKEKGVLIHYYVSKKENKGFQNTNQQVYYI